mmetsp:Transcript_36265/g.83354  ORF Transcript_36265/g.83354 Transcript_36265/m.83354 type:complete len:107 (-) Transcript_36265:2790-3110(-)
METLIAVPCIALGVLGIPAASVAIALLALAHKEQRSPVGWESLLPWAEQPQLVAGQDLLLGLAMSIEGCSSLTRQGRQKPLLPLGLPLRGQLVVPQARCSNGSVTC